MTPRPPRTPVLALLHPDGYTEVYAEKHIDVHIEVVPSLETPEGQRAVDEYLDRTLPKRHAALFYPSGLRASEMVRVIRPSDLARRDMKVALVKEMQAVKDETREAREGKKLWIL